MMNTSDWFISKIKPGILDRFEFLPTRLIILLIAGATLVVSLLFFWPSYIDFPMDDSYIHLVYARNLVDQGRLFFNEIGERGVGTSSILWVLLLSAGWKMGIPIWIIPKAIGFITLATVGSGLFLMLAPILRKLPAFACSLLVALSGNMLWFALSGMETMLFLALGILALLAYRKEQWVRLGIFLGLLCLTRPEGLALAVAILIIDVLRKKHLTPGLVTCGLICILICGPWFGYLLWRTGHMLPTGAFGKQSSSMIGVNYIMGSNGLLRMIGSLPGFIYIITWVVYLLEFTLGGMALPEPNITVGNIGGIAYTLSLWSIPGWVLILCLLFLAGKKLLKTKKWHFWLLDQDRRPFLVLAVWLILHNLSYMIFLPVPGTASRYGAINHIALWLILIVGLLTIVRHPRLLLGLTCGLVTIAASNTIFWNKVYDANLEHMTKVRIQAALFTREYFLPEEPCAAFDIGAVRYYSQRPILDLAGLLVPDFNELFEAGNIDHYLVDNNAACLILPGRIGVNDDGWFDFAKLLGLVDNPMIKLDLVKVFEIDRDRWLLGYLPTSNYQASVTVYRLDFK